jgi:hypothetical protein
MRSSANLYGFFLRRKCQVNDIIPTSENPMNSIRIGRFALILLPKGAKRKPKPQPCPQQQPAAEFKDINVITCWNAPPNSNLRRIH